MCVKNKNMLFFISDIDSWWVWGMMEKGGWMNLAFNLKVNYQVLQSDLVWTHK